MEEISYMIFLGEGQGVLDPHELHKPVPGLLEGFSHFLILSFVSSFFLSLTLVLFIDLLLVSLPVHAFIHAPIHCSQLSWRFTPFTFSPHLYSSFVFGLGRGNKLLKNNHCFVGCKDSWCKPIMNE
jgi:hypothetical protein